MCALNNVDKFIMYFNVCKKKDSFVRMKVICLLNKVLHYKEQDFKTDYGVKLNVCELLCTYSGSRHSFHLFP